jgi:hypothetical protein
LNRHVQRKAKWASALKKVFILEAGLTGRSRVREKRSKPLTVAYVLLVVFLFAGMLLILYPRPGRPLIPNICPIDGHVACMV